MSRRPKTDSEPVPSGLRKERGTSSRQDDQPESSRAPRSESETPASVDGVTRYKIDLDDGRIDSDAAKVVRRLTRHGYEAYLVGGCVRDLLLDHEPKDFDVCTDARPEDVRALFRNSRIIGRRFRLAHVLFGGGKVIETATFRRNPDENRDGDDMPIRSDNVFGDADEDALRRDFTINALFYDLETNEVLDWVGGMPDLKARRMHTIGIPQVRFHEDPVRMLRAIKFCARLDVGMSPEVYNAIVQCRDTLEMAAKPRLFEELLRFLRGGAAARSFYLAWELGILDVLLPELAMYLSDTEDDAVWRLLDEVDQLTYERGQALSDITLWTVLLLAPTLEACDGCRDRVSAGYEFMEPIAARLRVPRRISDGVRRIVAVLPRLNSGRPGRVAKTPIYECANEVREITRAAKVSLGEHRPPPSRRRRRKPSDGTES